MKMLSIRPRIAVQVLAVTLVVSALAGCAQQSKVLLESLSEPLEAKSAAVVIDAGDGNLTVGQLSGADQLLANGTLEYADNQAVPVHTQETNGSQTTLTLRAGGQVRQGGFQWPWQACGIGTDWQVNLNPAVTTALQANSNGGNIVLNLADMPLENVSAETGGGNLEIVLPKTGTDLTVKGKTGAGNVIIRIPSGTAARIQATTGMGKVTVDPQFNLAEGDTYQSAGYAEAAVQVEITLSSGAGNVNVEVY